MARERGVKHIVIIGGGIIGCSTAYYLTRHPSYNPALHRITLLEATELAGGSSGKAGGLLALWAYPTDIVPLSFNLHAQLAEEHDGEERWGYRRVHCGQLSAQGRPLAATGKKHDAVNRKQNGDSVSLEKRLGNAAGTTHANGVPEDLDWIHSDSIKSYDDFGVPSNTAQVHPYQFTTSMAELAREKGVDIKLGALVTSVDQDDPTKAVKSVTYIEKDSGKSETIQATDVILSAGPWTRTILPSAPISALRAHSVTIRPTRPVSAYALFTEIRLPRKEAARAGSHTVTPEIYARPNDEVYACGEGDTLIPLPKTSDLVQTDERRCQDIVDHVSTISDELRNGTVLVRQACYLPNVDGRASGPLIGKTGVKGLFLAAGHTCWGIQNGPGTGKLMSEFVFEGEAKSADVQKLDPRKVL